MAGDGMDWRDNRYVNGSGSIAAEVNGDMALGDAGSLKSLEALGIKDGNYSMLGKDGKIFGTMEDGNFKSAGGLFDGVQGMGSTMQGIGAIAQAAAGIYNAHNQKKYQDKLFKMEEKRVAREMERQDTQQKNYEKVFG